MSAQLNIHRKSEDKRRGRPWGEKRKTEGGKAVTVTVCFWWDDGAVKQRDLPVMVSLSSLMKSWWKKSELLLDLLSDAFKANIICSHKPAGSCCPPSARFSDQIVSQALFVLTEDWICSQSVKYNPTAKINPKTHITTDLNKTTDNHPKITEILSLNTHTSLFHHLSDTEGSVCGPDLTQRPILGGVWRLVLNLSLQWNQIE